MVQEIDICTIVNNFFSGSNALLGYNLSLSWDEQKMLLDSTILKPLVLKYPMNREYCKAFLKAITKSLEKSCEYVHDDVYSTYCDLMTSSCYSDEIFYKHYKILSEEDKFITIRESPNLIIHGTTGLRTWEAAVVLADWAVTNKPLFHDKCIVELGSGLGMTGIVISQMCLPKSFSFSDCHPRVLSALEENIAINFPGATRECPGVNVKFSGEHMCDLNIVNLDWNSVDSLALPETPDIVIGADIVYDASTFPVLYAVLKSIVSLNSKVQIVLVSTVRNEETLQEFIDGLDRNNFKMEKITHKNADHIHWSKEKDYCIMKIYM